MVTKFKPLVSEFLHNNVQVSNIYNLSNANNLIENRIAKTDFYINTL